MNRQTAARLFVRHTAVLPSSFPVEAGLRVGYEIGEALVDHSSRLMDVSIDGHAG